MQPTPDEFGSLEGLDVLAIIATLAILKSELQFTTSKSAGRISMSGLDRISGLFKFT